MKKIDTCKRFLLHIAPFVLLLSGCSEELVTRELNAPRPVHVLQLQQSAVSSRTTFPGQIQAVDSSALSFRVAGQLISLKVKEGERVRKGQLLAELDPHDFQVSVEELEARLDEAVAARDQARSEHRRVKLASQDDAVAAVDLDRALTNVKRAEASVATVEKNLQRAQDALVYTRLLAPFDGVVARREGHLYTNVAPGVPVYTLHNLERLEVKVDVPEHWLPRLQIGDGATVRVTAVGDRHFTGNITEIGTQASRFSNSYPVTLTLAESPAGLYADMSARVTLTGRDQQQGYWIPHTALTERDDETYVLVIYDGVAEKREVTIEDFNAQQLLVNGHINSKEYVVASGVHFIQPGQQVGQLLAVDPVQLMR